MHVKDSLCYSSIPEYTENEYSDINLKHTKYNEFVYIQHKVFINFNHNLSGKLKKIMFY